MADGDLPVAFDDARIHPGLLQMGIQQNTAAGAGFAIDDGYILARQVRNALDAFGISAGDDDPLLPDRIGDDGNGAFWEMFSHGRKIGLAGGFISQMSSGHMNEGLLQQIQGLGTVPVGHYRFDSLSLQDDAAARKFRDRTPRSATLCDIAFPPGKAALFRAPAVCLPQSKPHRPAAGSRRSAPAIPRPACRPHRTAAPAIPAGGPVPRAAVPRLSV